MRLNALFWRVDNWQPRESEGKLEEVIEKKTTEKIKIKKKSPDISEVLLFYQSSEKCVQNIFRGMLKGILIQVIWAFILFFPFPLFP